jgi:predicted transcriptional regulator
MFLPTPEDIKMRRMNLHLTQNELAKRAGVSQPLIARIEAGDVDPRLSTLQKIFAAFDAVEKGKVVAADIMHVSIVHTTPEDTVDSAVRLMEDQGFSQVPVLDNGVPVGSISTDTVVSYMLEHEKKDIGDMLVKEIMLGSFPTVSPTTDENTISHLLENSPAVLVVEYGKVIGVITKHDMMQLVHKK